MKTLAKLLFSVATLASWAVGQGGQVKDQAIYGGGVPNATVRVCSWSASPSVPCTPTVTIYSDRDLAAGHAIQNPTTSDSAGNYIFYIAPGLYTVQVSSSITATLSQSVMVPLAPDTSGLIPTSLLGTGTADSTTFLRGDRTWQTISFPSAYTTVQDEGTPLTQRSTINYTGAGITCSDSGGVTTCAVPGGGISGLTSGIFPIATGATTLGNSKLSDVSSLGIKYDLGSPGFWQLTTNNITWHPANLNDLVLEVTSTNPGFNLGGVKIKGASTTGSACGGHIQLLPGDSNSAGNNSTITADGGCSNGIGAIGASITLTAGSTAVNNGGGDINLNPGTGVFSNGSVKVTQSLTISGGTPIKKVLSATASLDFGNLVAIGCEDLTITVTGAALGDTVSIGVPNGSVPGTTAQFSGWVSSANTVTIRYCDLIGGDPASGTFRATVTQF